VGIRSSRRVLAFALGLAVVSTMLDPILENQVFGQINILLMLLVLIDFQRWMPARWHGIAVGIAAGIKLTPLIFIVYLLCTGRRRAAGQAMIAFAVTVVIGFLALPSASKVYWIDRKFLDTTRMLTMTDVDHSLAGFLARTAGTPTSPPGWSVAVSIVIGVLGLVVATSASRRGRELLGVLLVAFTGVLISPVTWIPHMVWIVPALVWLVTEKWRRTGAAPGIVLFVVVLWFTVPIYWYANRVGDAVPFQTTWKGNALGTLGSPMFPVLLAVISAPLWLRWLRPTIGTIDDGPPSTPVMKSGDSEAER
jgi:alpha-1,2-mannosyltransferase